MFPLYLKNSATLIKVVNVFEDRKCIANFLVRRISYRIFCDTGLSIIYIVELLIITESVLIKKYIRVCSDTFLRLFLITVLVIAHREKVVTLTV